MSHHRVYTVVRVTTIIETCRVVMPNKKLAEHWAKSSDAERVEHTTGWKAEGFIKEWVREPGSMR